MTKERSDRLRVLDLGRVAYEPAFALQEQMVQQRLSGGILDTLVLVEHDPVYTMGRNAKESNLLASGEMLAALGARVVRTTRGGDVTYHGPGQVVGYPILDLGARGRGVGWYIDRLEQVLMQTLEDFGVRSGPDPRNRGVWVGNCKIAAIGVRITRGITLHGFALNVCTDLGFYDAIVPCGIRDAGVTSLHLLRPGIAPAEVRAGLVRHFAEVFEYRGVEAGVSASGPG